MQVSYFLKKNGILHALRKLKENYSSQGVLIGTFIFFRPKVSSFPGCFFGVALKALLGRVSFTPNEFFSRSVEKNDCRFICAEVLRESSPINV